MSKPPLRLHSKFHHFLKKYCSNNKFYTFAAVKIFRMKNLVNIVVSLVVVVVVCG